MSEAEEPALSFEGAKLTPQKEVVRIFYHDLWDKADKSWIPKILHADFNFRGSLGPVLVGHEQFAGYVDWVVSSLAYYRSDILTMVEEGPRVVAKMRFYGIHQKEVFGVAPTGRKVWWHGMAMFTFEGARVRDLWVLGDVHGLVAKLKGEKPR